MAVMGVAAPGRHPRGASAVRQLAQRTAQHAGQHLTAAARRLSGSVVTALGLGCIDTGAFEAHPIAGWVVTGLSVLLLDWKLDSGPGDQ